jgi:hypothetical protein
MGAMLGAQPGTRHHPLVWSGLPPQVASGRSRPYARATFSASRRAREVLA